MRLAILLALVCCGCAPRQLRPERDVYNRPGYALSAGRILLTTAIRAEKTVYDPTADRQLIAGMTRAGATAAGRSSAPEPVIVSAPQVLDGATLIPSLSERMELEFSKLGYTVVAADSVVEAEVVFSMSTVRYANGWVADTAALKFREPDTGRLMRSIEVRDGGGPVHPYVLLEWLIASMRDGGNP